MVHAFVTTNKTRQLNYINSTVIPDISKNIDNSKNSVNVEIPLAHISYYDQLIFKHQTAKIKLWKPSKSDFRFGIIAKKHHASNDRYNNLLTNITNGSNTMLSGINIHYQFHPFSAEFGLVNKSADTFNGNKFYLQGGLRIFEHSTFNLGISVNIETWDEKIADYHYSSATYTVQNIESYIQDSVTNASLGIVGTYNVNSQWRVVGSLSSELFNSKVADNLLVDHQDHTMVIIGTSYSF